MAIELILNHPTTELLREGWACTKQAASFRGAVYDDGEERLTAGEMAFEVEGTGEAAVAVDSDNLWQEPETGVVWLRPHVYRSDLLTNPVWAPNWIGAAQLDYSAPDLLEIPQTGYASVPKVLITRRANQAAELIGLPVVPTHLLGLTNPGGALDKGGLKWIARTNFQLYANEAVSFLIGASGIGTDKAGDLFAVALGKRWLIQMGLNGQATISQSVGSPSAAKWVRRKRFEWVQGGANNDADIQVTIIFSGVDGISVLCSSAPQAQGAESSGAGVSEGGVLFQAKKHGYTPPWDPVLKHFVKAEPDNLTIALPSKGVEVRMAIARVRYSACGLRLAPEPIGEPKPGKTPRVTPIGYYPGGSIAQRGVFDATPGASYVNEKGEAWNANRDYWIAASTWLKPSTNGVYSPEIWAMEYEVDPTTHTPTTTPVDLSARWRRLSWRMSEEPDASYLSVLYDRSGDFENLYKLDGPVRLRVGGVTVFEGKILHSRPYTEGGVGAIHPVTGDPKSVPIITDEAEAADLWEDLNDTGVGHDLGIGKTTFGDLFRRAFKRAGVPPAQVSISADLDALQIDGWDRPNDYKTPNEDATAGDLIRGVIDRYGAQASAGPRDIRVARWDGVWYADLTAEHDPEAMPPLAFFLDPLALPDPFLTDADRWAGVDGVRYLRTLSKPEWTIRRPKWNGLRAYASTGAGDGSDALAAFIAPDPRSLSNSDDVDYQARARILTFGPPETSMASTQNELERMARRRFDKLCRVERGLVIEAEWKPFVRPGATAIVLGIAPADGPDYALGDVISYGVWRLASIDCEVTMGSVTDDPEEGAFGGSDPAARDFDHRGLYSMEWMGSTAIEGLPMFTGLDKLPREGAPIDA